MKLMEKHLKNACERVLENHKAFGVRFPSDESKNYVYELWDGGSWTEGFWTGMNILSYEYTQNEEYMELINRHIKYFKDRLETRSHVQTHDLGFLYSLSCVAKYKVDGDEQAKNTALEAAELLTERFRKKGGFIQAWGALDDPTQYRLIIDGMMNMPLLFWAYEQTGDKKYYDIAKKHLDTTLKTVIRDDCTTYHTYYFDAKTGKPSYGRTAQGYSDNSCWARGQAWAIYGTALAYKYTKDIKFREIFNAVTDLFVDRLPEDYVPYWDLIFGDDSGEERDTSAAAIAVCGIYEMNKYYPSDKYMDAANKMMLSLGNKYNISKKDGVNGILSDAMYSKPNGCKAEANIWGDYFYMEALMRMVNPKWEIYW